MGLAILSWTSAAVVVVVMLVLVYGLIKISMLLRAIGGTPSSALADLGYTLEAIEKETAPLTGLAVRLNNVLRQIRNGLAAVDSHLTRTRESMPKQENRP